MELRWVGRTDGEVNDYDFPCVIKNEKNVTEWKPAECRPQLHEWNRNAFTVLMLSCFCRSSLLVQLLSAPQASASVFGPFITASHFLFCSYIDSYCVCGTPPLWVVCSWPCTANTEQGRRLTTHWVKILMMKLCSSVGMCQQCCSVLIKKTKRSVEEVKQQAVVQTQVKPSAARQDLLKWN